MTRARELKEVGALAAVRPWRASDGTEYAAGDAIQAKHRQEAMLLGGAWVRPASATETAGDKRAKARGAKTAATAAKALDVAEAGTDEAPAEAEAGE